MQLIAMLHLLSLTLVDDTRTKLITKSERGSDTIEKVIWAVAVIGLVAIVVGAIRVYLNTKAGAITDPA